MHSRDDEKMEGAGALKAETKAVIQPVAVAEEHRVQHPGVVRREAEKLWQHEVWMRCCVGKQAIRSPGLSQHTGCIEGLSFSPALE